MQAPSARAQDTLHEVQGVLGPAAQQVRSSVIDELERAKAEVELLKTMVNRP